MKTVKTINVLKHAERVLSLRRRIVAKHRRHRNEMTVESMQTRTAVSRLNQEIAHHELSVIEAVARVRQLKPAKPVDPVKRIHQREQQVLAKVSADANIRAAVEQRLRAQAKQAALDRAVFIDQVKRDLPAELWDETIDTYDRRVYESGDGGST